ncbi:MAG: ABC transporter permease [Betaproteobacteria bacterium]|nr:ABC transporter permease [Betaproteobacteria bacterium]
MIAPDALERRAATVQRVTRIAAPVGVALLVLIVWQVLVTAYDLPRYIVPSPLVVLQALVEDWGLLWHSLLVTLKITLGAFALAVLLGTLVAFLFAQSRWLELSLFPYAVILQVTPIVAVAPLIIIWVRDTQIALILCATIVAIFPVISNTTLGLRSVDPGLMNLMRLYKAGSWSVLWRLRVPSAAPYFFGALRISSGLALIGAVVAEFVAGTGAAGAGLAYQILQAGLQLNVPRLFAALIVLTLTGVALFLAMVWLSKAALRNWHESELTVEMR